MANLGTLLFENGNVHDAETHLLLALEMDPKLPSAWNVLGALQHGAGRSADAVQSWKRAVELDDTQCEALYNLGFLLVQMERPGEARGYLEHFVRSAPPDRYGQDLEDARWLLTQFP